MLLRIFLIVSILAGGGIIALTHFQVKPRVQEIIDQREKEKDRANKNEAGWKKTEKELASTKRDLQRTQTELSETTSQLTAMTKKANDFEVQSKSLKGQLDKANQDLTLAKQDLAAWVALGLTVDQVKGVIDHAKKLTNDLAMAQAEYAILQKAHKDLQRRYDELTGSEEVAVPLPPGLKGKVLVVDPKWDFVVLDIGDKQQVVPKGIMMVSRNGKLIAKVKIVSVQADRSIANIMPGWKLGDVMEGDQVVY